MSQRPGGAPFMDRLPQSVVDRYEATQKTAAKGAGDEALVRKHVPLTDLLAEQPVMEAVLKGGTPSDTPHEPVYLKARPDIPGKYEIADGHHRVRDAIEAGRGTVEADIDPIPDDEPYEPPFYDFSQHMPPKTASMSDAERQRFRSGQCLGLACEMAKRQGGRVGLYTGYGNSLVHAVSVHPQTGSHWDIGGENDPEILHEMYTDLHGPIEYHEVSPEEARQRKFDDLPEQDFDEATRYAHRVLGTEKTATVAEDGGCNGEGYLPRGIGEQLPDGTITGLCISCMQFHPMTEVIPPSKPEWKREFRLAPHTPHKTAAVKMIDLYHRTDPEAADAIMKSKRFGKPGDEREVTYFAKTPDMLGYGSSCIHARVPEHLVHEDEDMSTWDDGTEVDDDDKHWMVWNENLKPEHIIGRTDD